jgi:ribonuclease HI
VARPVHHQQHSIPPLLPDDEVALHFIVRHDYALVLKPGPTPEENRWRKNKSEPKKETIYTDGACLGNPGPGGYGVVLLYGGHRKELSGGFRLTTNNRMEMMAVIVGLQALKGRCAATVCSDSQYVVRAISEGWAAKWRANNWKRNKKEMAVNPDLWEQLLDLCEQHEVQMVWVRGHSGVKENERCDELSVAAANQRGLPIDKGYEKTRGR